MKVRWRLNPAGWKIMGHRWTHDTIARQNIEDYEAFLKRRKSKPLGEAMIDQILEAKQAWRRP